MISTEKVFERFKLLTDMTSEEAAEWLPLCSKSTALINNKIKKDADIEKYALCLEHAAAACAYYSYMMIKASKSCDNVKLGDISVSSSGAKESMEFAKIIKNDAISEIAHLLTDDKFVFMGV